MKLFKKSMATVGMLCVGAFAVCGLTACSNDADEALARLSLLLDEKVESNENGISADLDVPYSVTVNSKDYLVEYSTNLDNAKVETNAEEKTAKIAITQIGEEQSFTLTAKVSSKSKSWDFKITAKDLSMVKTQAEVDAMEDKKTYAEWATLTTGKALIQGYVTHAHDFSASYGDASVWLQDDNGGYYAYRVKVASQADFNDYFQVGSKIAVAGTVASRNGWQEMDSGCSYYYIKDAEKKTYDFKDVTELWGANEADAKEATAVQNQKIKVTGKVTSVPDFNSSSMTVGLSVNGHDYNIYYKSAYTSMPKDLADKLSVGYTIEVEGIAAVSSKKAQICPIKADAITVKSTEVTAQDKVNGAKAEVAKQNIKSSYYDSLKTPLELLTTTKDGCKVSYALSSELKATLNKSSTAPNNMSADLNNAEYLGLNPSIFNVSAAKNKTSNLPYIGPNEIRLYSAPDSGQGTSATFAVADGYVIRSVKVIHSTGTYDKAPAEALKVTADDKVITGEKDVYIVNGGTVTFQNIANKKVNNKNPQIRINLEFVVEAPLGDDSGITLTDNKLNVVVNEEKSSSAKLTATISLDGANNVTHSWVISTKTKEDVIKKIDDSVQDQKINFFYDKDTVGSRVRLLEPTSPSNKPVTIEYSLGDTSEYVKLGQLHNSTIYYFDIAKAPEEGMQTVALKYKFTYDGVVKEGVLGNITVVPKLTPLLKYQVTSKGEVIDWDLKGVVTSVGYDEKYKNCLATIMTDEGPVYVFHAGDNANWTEKFIVGKTVTLNGGTKGDYYGLNRFEVSNLDKQVKVGKEDIKEITPVDLTKLAQDEKLNSANWVKQQGAYASVTGKLVKEGSNYYLEVKESVKFQVYNGGKFSNKDNTAKYLETLTAGTTYTFTGIIEWHSVAQLVPTTDTGFAQAN